MQTFHLNSRLGFSVEFFYFFINIPTVHKVCFLSLTQVLKEIAVIAQQAQNTSLFTTVCNIYLYILI